MNLLSKNSPVEQSINKMKEVLKDVGCEASFSQEKHPLENCYSVNLASNEAPNHIYSNGKGVISDASIARYALPSHFLPLQFLCFPKKG